MKLINEENLILEKEAFSRTEIEKRMVDGEFNSLSKFELFIWDLEMFLQLQKRLNDKIILKGGAATQFYIPVASQRTSIDIDMICLASRDEVHKVIAEIEKDLGGVDDYCKFKLYTPKNPKLNLDVLETYYETVPSICSEKELFVTKGKQEVKIEFLFSDKKYKVNTISQPELFALKTQREFNVLAFEYLFADKLTTLGPNTIGIPDERADEQMKQIYDVITLFVSNLNWVLENKQLIKQNYEKAARDECKIHNLEYNGNKLFEDMKVLINRLINIENDDQLIRRSNDFQGLYLRRCVNRDKAGWAIVGYQLNLLIDYIFADDTRLLHFREIDEFIKILGFEHVRGPEHGKINREVRELLVRSFGRIPGLSNGLFKRRIDRIVWELITFIDFSDIQEVLEDIINKNMLTDALEENSMLKDLRGMRNQKAQVDSFLNLEV